MSLHPLSIPPLSDQTIWLIVGVGGMIGLYLLLRPRAKKGDPLGSVPKFPLARQRSVEQQMSNLLVELSEMARQITAQLDTRATKLELLIKEADEKLAALRAALAAPNHQSPDHHPAHRSGGIDSTTDSTRDSKRASSVSDARPTTSPLAKESAIPPAPTMDQRHAQVYALADEGRAANEIARLLQRPAGEIELILALRGR
jgi:phage shock protein A